jgi:hypothetical protein
MGATLDMPARPYYAHQHRVVAVGGGLEASWEASKQPVILKSQCPDIFTIPIPLCNDFLRL